MHPLRRLSYNSNSIEYMSLQAKVSGILSYSKAEDFPICQVLYAPTNKIMIFPATDSNNLTAEQIIELISSEASVSGDLDLFIKYPNNYELLLSKDDTPFSISDSLFFLPLNPDYKEKLNSHYLKATVKKSKNRSSIFIPVIDQNSQLLYMMPVQSTYQNFNMVDIIKTILNVHNCSIDSVSVYTKRGTKLDKEKIKKITIRHILKEAIYLSILKTDKIEKQIQKRMNVLYELKSTETNFLNTIDGFVTNIKPIFKKTNILNDYEIEKFASAVQYIKNLQKKIVSDLNEMKLDYMTLIGQWFKEYAPFLKGYDQYLEFYKTNLPNITKAMNSKEYTSLFESFSNTAFSNSLRFDSLLVIPVQHSPRYILLLKEVLKQTPKYHPDYEDLNNTFDLVDETIQKLNDEVTLLQKKYELLNLESKFSSDVGLFRPDRLFIGSFETQNNKNKFLFLFFSNEIWICKITKDKKLTQQNVLSYDDTNVTRYANKSVSIQSLSGRIDKLFLLESCEMQDMFISDFRKEAINYLSIKREITFKYERIEKKSEIYLADHSCASINGTFYVFGGRDNKGNLRNDLYRFTAENTRFEKMPTKSGTPIPCPRYMSAFCAIETGVFLFGGKSNEKDSFSDFWFYSFKYERWQEMSKKNDPENDPPPAGYGLELFHTKTETKGDILVLVGGKEEFGIYIYIMKQKVWNFVECRSGINLLSLYGHSAVPLCKKPGCCLIIGGKFSDGNYNNFIFFLSTERKSVDPIVLTRINPINRYQHRCVCLHNIIYCFGGDSDETIPFALSLNLSKFIIPKVEGGKNLAVKGFALFADENNIYLHGGFDKKGEVLSNLLKITVNDSEIVNNSSNYGDSFMTNDIAKKILQDPISVYDETWEPD